MTQKVTITLGITAAVLGVLVVIGVERCRGRAPGEEAFEYAFKFASAIRTDAKDRQLAQEKAVLDLAGAGRLDDAERLAKRIEGWRRGTACADIAVLMAQNDRKEDAMRLIQEVENFQENVEGWQRQRITAHLAHAYGALGNEEKTRSLGALLLYEEETKGISAKSLSHAANGRFEPALEELGALNESKDFEATWWRTRAYLALGRSRAFTAGQRGQALELAERSALDIPGWKQQEALLDVAEAYRNNGDAGSAGRILHDVEQTLLPLPLEGFLKIPLLCKLARNWQGANESQRCGRILEEAASLVDEVQPIERPAALADIAAGHLQAGEREHAARIYAEAMELSGRLVNARPRALALVDVCRSMGREGMDLDAPMRNTLRSLFDGLKAPW